MKLSNGIRKVLVGKNWFYYLLPGFLGYALGGVAAVPIAVACFRGAEGLKLPSAFVGLSALIGVLCTGDLQISLLAAAAMVIAVILDLPFENTVGDNSFRHSVQATLSVLIVFLLANAIEGINLADFAYSMVQSLLAFIGVQVIIKAGEAVGVGYNKYATQDGRLYIGMLIAIAVQCLPQVIVSGFDLKLAIWIAIVQYYAKRAGVIAGVFIGAISGALAGALYLGGYEVANTVFLFAMSGFFSGVFYRYGRLTGTLGFLLGNALFAFINNSTTKSVINLTTLIVTTIGTILIPIIGNYTNLDIIKNLKLPDIKPDAGKQPYTLSERLASIAGSIREFVRAFGESAATTHEITKEDMCGMFSRIACKACNDCVSSSFCWDKEFFETCKAMMQLTDVLSEKHYLETRDMPAFFKNSCKRSEQVMVAATTAYEVLQTEAIWRERMRESKDLMARQLTCLAALISGLSRDIGGSRVAIWALEREVEETLDREFDEVEAYIWKDKKGRLEVELKPTNCTEIEWDCEFAAILISKVTGKRMVFDCIKYRNENDMTAKFVEADVYNVATGIARRSKLINQISGDSFTYDRVRNGVYLAGLSDGMGTGADAANFSSAAVNLLEGLVCGGIDLDTAAGFVNATMLLQEEGEAFVTLDMALIDLFDGETQFLKVGAVPTIIKNDSRVELITSTVMPAGMYGNIEMKPETKMLKDGDLLIFMSDGVFEALMEKQGEEYVIKLIENLEAESPQQLADGIMRVAIGEEVGEFMDDMSVMTLKLWKKVC